MTETRKLLNCVRTDAVLRSVYINDKGATVDSVFKSACGVLFLISEDRVIGMFNHFDSTIVMFNTKSRFGTVDEMVDFAQAARSLSVNGIIDTYASTPNLTEVIS
jgi:hypothetical protein